MNSPQRRLKIFRVITRLSVGGATLYNILLTSHLKKRGHDSCLVSGQVGKNEESMLPFIDPEILDFARFDIPELSRSLHPLKDLKALLKIVQLFRKERPDIVHTHTSKAGFLGRLAAWLAGVPIKVHSVHGSVFNGHFGFWKSHLFILLEKFAGKISDCLFTDTASIRQELMDRSIAAEGNIRVMPIGLDLEKFRNIDTFRGFLRNHLHVPPPHKIVGMVTRLVPIKGVTYLLEAIPEILAKYPAVQFVIAGDGELKTDLMHVAHQLGISDAVTFLGFWGDLREVYADFDMTVLSSLSEGSPVSVLESMAAGIPVIASAVGGVPDVIAHEVTGLLVPPKDVSSLAQAVLRLLGNQEMGRRLAQSAKQMVLDTYSIERSAERTEAIYWQLLHDRIQPAK